MRHIAAYLLLQIGGNASPSAGDVQKVLNAVGIESDEDRLEKLISELDGKDINALIAEGSAKLSSVSLDQKNTKELITYGRSRFLLAALSLLQPLPQEVRHPRLLLLRK
ncbi:hypothetical protein K503DRAFT_610289 [Rhizopogon vinicolor AM-OR11-026]|uniref:60S acidic ribosomal protein P2 n=1 Tax=Rhizopogon vinicolor AM-OR11-026 TaxID=1314800 RepID=A0A1B7NG81_9AGAM|nr:hypothetical protein K503DRAFT_610289 [Rhizopogon vinicolor AM-OR11-026]